MERKMNKEKPFQAESMLERIAKDLANARTEKGICPTQKSGKEISGETTTFCVVPACRCEYLGETHIFDMGDLKMAYHMECLYKAEK
jgi:hypothetical protein